jgi:integrase
MRGTIIRRGTQSWRLKFDVERSECERSGGKRETRYVTVRGSKRDAQIKLAELLASVGQGSFVEPHKTTVAAFVRARVDQWEAAGDITARTAQRYRQLVEHQIVPELGAKALQKLKPLDIEDWHTALRKGGLAARTIGHAHRVLGKALADAERADTEMAIVRDVPAFVLKIAGERLYAPAMVALFTGMRLGEVLALRWNHVDLDGKTIAVRAALEATTAHGIRLKTPKSRAGRRDITLPDLLVDVLREHRKAQLELRMQFGLGRLPDDALLFANLDGGPLQPSNVSSDWGEVASRIGVPEVTFHGLRHTHASQLIASGVDIVTISKRLGHAKPSVTLAIYAHMFTSDDSKAAAAINAALKR